MNLPKIHIAGYLPADLAERITAWNNAAAAAAAERTALDDRCKDLSAPDGITPENAAARLKAIDKARAERLALLAESRRLIVEGLALLDAMHLAGKAESSRLAEASRERQDAIREGLAALKIGEELAVRRAFIGDAELHALQGAAAQVGQGHIAKVHAFEVALAEVNGEMVKLLTA